MNKALPTITESVQLLHQKLKAEADPQKRLRLQGLYLIASKQARSRQAVSQLLAVHRNTVAGWLSLYQHGGIDQMLNIKRPAGKKSSLSDQALTDLKERLAQPEGFASYREIHQYLQREHKIHIGYAAVHKLVRYNLKAKPKSPRPAHPKKTKQK
jgi:transposase